MLSAFSVKLLELLSECGIYSLCFHGVLNTLHMSYLSLKQNQVRFQHLLLRNGKTEVQREELAQSKTVHKYHYRLNKH
jgi:hypothetical protein